MNASLGEETQVRRLRTGLSSDDCYDYTFILLMLLHLPLLNLIISVNIDCAQKEHTAQGRPGLGDLGRWPLTGPGP